MTDPVKCRWPACEDDTDCMNGCKPHPMSPSEGEAMPRQATIVISDWLANCQAGQWTPFEAATALKAALSKEGYSVARTEYIEDLENSAAPQPVGSPLDAKELVQDTWFTDRSLPIMAVSADIDNARVLKLHFRHAVTDKDRARLIEVLNAGETALSLPAEGGARDTYTEICMNKNCPRGGTSVEVVRPSVSRPQGNTP